jgi:hypothetical protein
VYICNKINQILTYVCVKDSSDNEKNHICIV